MLGGKSNNLLPQSKVWKITQKLGYVRKSVRKIELRNLQKEREREKSKGIWREKEWLMFFLLFLQKRGGFFLLFF